MGPVQRQEYLYFNQQKGKHNVLYSTGFSIQEMPVASAILFPADKAVVVHGGTISCSGWAYSGGGHWIERVEVSSDGQSSLCSSSNLLSSRIDLLADTRLRQVVSRGTRSLKRISRRSTITRNDYGTWSCPSRARVGSSSAFERGTTLATLSLPPYETPGIGLFMFVQVLFPFRLLCEDDSVPFRRPLRILGD